MVNKDQITLYPASLHGDVKIPSSKSLSHRALIAASLSNGVSKISNLVFSNDVTATIHALESIGAKFDIREDSVIVTGVKKIKAPHKDVYCNESGSTLRFLIPLLSLTGKEVSFSGEKSLIKRPQTIYKKLFEENDSSFVVSENNITIKGSIKAKDYYLEGNVSSQFFSGLMFALPLLEDDSRIYISSKLESKSYIDLTIDVLSRFGIRIQEIENGYYIEGNQTYTNTNYKIEGDFSQAAFFLVAGILNGSVISSGLNPESKQGDEKIIDFIKQVNGKIVHMENGFSTSLTKTTGAIIDIADCPDLGPIIALLLSLSSGKSRIINAKRLRYKESDRIESTVSTLKLLGANIKTEIDDIVIYGRKTLSGAVVVDSYNDHRIAMMVAIAALVCDQEITLTGAKSINKSYPHFIKDYISLGGKVK